MNPQSLDEIASDTKWIALYTKANQESAAISNIKRQGYDAYCPMIERTRRHARKVEQVRRPLFPSYIFASLDNQKQQWRPLLSTVGVRAVVRFNDKLGFLPDGFIEKLRVFEEQSALNQLIAPRIKPGMQVKILDGPFENLIARVVCTPEKERIWLLLDIMGRKVRIQQDIWSVASS